MKTSDRILVAATEAFGENGYGVTTFDSFDPSHYSEWTSLMDEVIIGDIREETTITSFAPA